MFLLSFSIIDEVFIASIKAQSYTKMTNYLDLLSTTIVIKSMKWRSLAASKPLDRKGRSGIMPTLFRQNTFTW